MPTRFSQNDRRIQITTPLGADVLLLQSVRGQEGVSRLFSFELHMLSTNRSVSFDDVVGKEATVTFLLPGDEERYINGIVSRFAQGGTSSVTAPDGTPQYLAHYSATLVAWPWLLTRTSDCRIYQNLSVPDIIQKVFQDFGFSDFENNLHGNYEEREYCVQYRETYFDFVSRLMEEEGIFYFFKHEAQKHTLVLADNTSEFDECPHLASMSYVSNIGEAATREAVTEWSVAQEVRPGKYRLNDFDFEKPNTDLTAEVEGHDERRYEIYDYPGGYTTRDEGDRLVGIRMQEEEVPLTVVRGAGTYAALASGFKVDLKSHYRRDLNKTYVVTAVHHDADLGDAYLSGAAGSPDEGEYSNAFECIPHPTPFRPRRITPVPFVRGTQTAIVVGPHGEEIFADKYGRVKVQFHWDREGKYDENSSCWVRVSQYWAGKRWGAMFLPRIGQEVIVDFLEGDPDRPLITGRVYNGSAMPPYALPGEKAKSTVKSATTPGSAGFNELRFDDSKGNEQLFIHAERDEDIRIKNDKREWVARDTHLHIEHDDKDFVKNEKHLVVRQDHYEHVSGDREVHIDSNYLQKIDGKKELTITGNKTESVNGNKNVSVAGDRNEKVTGTISRQAGKNIQEKTGQNYAHQAGMAIHLKAGMTCVIEAGMQLSLKVGGNFIDIGPTGVTIMGTMVLINSGGAAGSGAGSSPTDPETPEAVTDAKEADIAADAEPGEAAELPPPKHQRKIKKHSPAALQFIQAAQDGKPFCAL